VGHLTTQPYAAEDAPAFIDYMDDLLIKTERLQDEGRVPNDDNVRDFLDFWRSVVHLVKVDMHSPGTTPETMRSTRIPMTEAEYKATWSLLDPINSLIVVLEVGGAIELHRTDAALRVVKAVYRGVYE
jgi:hypothetical protein